MKPAMAASERATCILMLALLAVPGCSSDTMSNGDWAEGPLREDGAAIERAISETTDGMQGRTFRTTDCTKLDSAASSAREHKKPQDKQLAGHWQEVIRAVESAASHCRANEAEAFLEDLNAVSTGLGAAKRRVADL